MAISLETQEIMMSFSVENKDNLESWGKYELDELEDAIAEMSDEEVASSSGKRIKDRIEELKSGHDQVKEARVETASDNPLDDGFSEDDTQEMIIDSPISEIKSEESKQKTPIIIGGIIIGVIVLMLIIYFV